MRLWPRHWHAETWACSLRGHVLPAAHAQVIGPEDTSLGAVLPDGRRLARCLRCDCWVEHAIPVGDAVRYERLPTLEELAKPRRGRALEEAIVMRLLSLNKALHALAFTLLGIVLTVIDANLGGLKRAAQKILDGIQGPIGDTGQEPSRTWLGRHLTSVLDLKAHTITVLIVLTFAYAAIGWCECYGLWRERRWAEYLTVIATTGFLPLEIHELLDRVTALRVIGVVLNVAIVIWLVRAKRLFGVRGGAAGLHHDLDWEALLAGSSPAVARSRP